MTIEQMIADLKQSGWKAKTHIIWQSPWGPLFLGPAGAWKIMNSMRSKGKFINHKNGDPKDNSIGNLEIKESSSD